MDLMGFLANGVCAWISLVLCLIAVVSAIAFIMNDDIGKSNLVGSAFFGMFALLFIFEFFFGNTHQVIPLNYKAVVVDSTTGKIVGDTRSSGMTDFPFFGSSLYKFPSATNQNICKDFTPSVQGGYEVKINICFYVDTSNADWVTQIKKYNKYEYEELVNLWIPQIAPKIAESVKDYIPADLTGKRAEVSAKLLENTKAVFAKENLVLNNVALTNWDFTNPEVAKAYDQTVVARTAQMKAQAELDASQTSLKALEVMSEGQSLSLKKLGISGENAVVQWLYLQWLQKSNTTPVVVVNSGGNSSSPIVGVNSQPLPVVETKK